MSNADDWVDLTYADLEARNMTCVDGFEDIDSWHKRVTAKQQGEVFANKFPGRQ